ncbi:MAG: endonuclease III [Polyangiales bacterium]
MKSRAKATRAKAKPPAKRAAPAKKKAAVKKPAATKAKEAAKSDAATPPTPQARKRAADIEVRLSHAMPQPICELDHQNAWQLLIATILSAQSTDRMVNKVTPALFATYPTPAVLGAADQAEVEVAVKSTGFFRNKAKAIRAASQQIAERFGGEVPRDIDALMTLPGVARKTANVVLGTAYRIPSGMTIDTHATRVAQRLALTRHEDPVKIERELCALFETESWIDMGHRFVLHGRYVCLAKKPRCSDCPLNELCDARETKPEHTWQTRATREGERIAARDLGTGTGAALAASA